MTDAPTQTSPKTRLLLAVLAAIGFILRLLPLRWTSVTCSFLGRIVGYFLGREKRISEAQLQFALGDRCSNPTKTYRGILAHYGACVAESANFNYLLASAGESETGFPRVKGVSQTGENLIAELLGGKRSVVALSGHIGNFELLAAYHIRCGAKLYVVGRNPNYPAIDDALKRLRASYGVETIWRSDPRAGTKLLKAIKAGHNIAALIDQDTDLGNEFAPFFGLDAASPAAPIQLALKYKLPILSTFIVRKSRLQHHVISERIDYDPKDDAAFDMVLRTFNERLEELIQTYPEQWPWWHRRWRRRPGVDYQSEPEKLPSTAEYLEWLARQ